MTMTAAILALVGVLWVPARTSALAAEMRQTMGFIVTIAGPNLSLDDGSLVRLAPGTKIIRQDGTAGSADDLSRQARVIVSYAPDGTVAEVRAFRPRSVQETYLSTLAPLRGWAVVTSVGAGPDLRARSLSLVRTTYARNPNWVRFVSEIRYDPKGAPGAPGAARFGLKDSFGDLIVERVVPAGSTARFEVGLDNQATERLTLETTAAGEGALQPEWCLWLDPRFVQYPTGPPVAMPSPRVVERLADALVKSLGQAAAERLAVAEFTPWNVPADQFTPREVSEQLLTLLGQRLKVVGVMRRRPEVGAPLSDADRQELARMGASLVVSGSITGRPDGTVLNAVIVRVSDGALIGAASERG
jgi:hypothetical protein